jgi:D-alanyl-D-alanine carboxypeptidase
LPNDEQVTTARDQAMLGRAIQDRFPRYYRYFSTSVFNYRGQSIRNHNHLLGSVEGVDGIKTGYTRASGFNLVSSMRRGNRHLVGVVLGGRSGGSRDAIMRNLLAENLDKAATTRTVVAITEKNVPDGNTDMAQAEMVSRPSEVPCRPITLPSLSPMAAMAPAPARRRQATSLMAQAAAARLRRRRGRTAGRPEPAPLTSGVIQTQPISAIPGSAEPMKPVRVKTVQVKAGQMKLASAEPSQPAPPVTNAIPARPEVAETSSAVVASAAVAKTDAVRETARNEMPPQPANFGTGNGILGVLPASSVPAVSRPQAVAGIDSAPRAEPAQQNVAGKPAAAAAHTGWIIQVGALESESEARQRIDLARSQSRGLLNKADPFTEPVVAKDNRKLFRARFAGLERDQAEAVCRTLKRADISCITVRN